MKKSLVALAVLAASGASFAQSSVSVYGVVDLWVGTNKTDNGTTSLSQTKLDAGGVSSNRWGLKGSEDLGGGLKANFNLEQGFNADDGTAANAALAFSRQSWVGFSGGFGDLRVGRTTTPYDDVSGASDAVFDSALSPLYYVAPSTGYTARPNNTIYYQAPDFGGFSGALSYSLGEDRTSALGASSTTSMNLTYGAGPMAVQFAYQKEDMNTTADDTSYTRLGASYNFGVATLMGTYGKTDNLGNVSGAAATDWQLGVDYPVSSALTVSASYAKSSSNAAAGDFDAKGYGIGASYSLSKRTSIYGGFESDKTSFPATPDAKHDLMAVGVRHAF